MIRLQDWQNEKLAAKCVFPRLTTERFFSDSEYKSEIVKLIILGVGGFCIFTGTDDEVGRMTEELQLSAEIPLLFCADFEHGLPMRLQGGTAFPHAMALGIADNPEVTEQIGRAIAVESRTIGVHWNLSPVCDINSNPKNPIINIRSFGENKEIVTKHSLSYISGTQSEKVLACAKHFPGHGDTDVDSHLALPVLRKSIKEIEDLELKSFEAAIKNGVKSIMVAHLAIPAIDESNTPASLSENIIQNLLREKMGFQGLIVTDALDMKSISDSYPSGEASVKCISAGANIALIPQNPFEAIEALTKEAEKNEEFRLKLINSVKLIIDAKRWCGLMSSSPPELKEKMNYFPTHEKLALKAGVQALRTSGTDILPIGRNQIFAGFAIMQNEDVEPGAKFFSILSQAVDNDCDFGFIDKDLSDEDIDMLKTGIADADLIILAYFFRARAYKGSIGLDDDFKKKISRLVGNRPIVSVLFGNPYLIDELKSDAFVLAYSDSLPSIAAAVLEITGKVIDFDRI